MDEPFSNLDFSLKSILSNEVKKLLKILEQQQLWLLMMKEKLRDCQMNAFCLKMVKFGKSSFL